MSLEGKEGDRRVRDREDDVMTKAEVREGERENVKMAEPGY